MNNLPERISRMGAQRNESSVVQQLNTQRREWLLQQRMPSVDILAAKTNQLHMMLSLPIPKKESGSRVYVSHDQ